MKQLHTLAVLFTLAFIARLIFFYLFLEPNPVRLAYDSGHYHSVAVRVAQGKGFTSANGAPYFYRLPGYPCFLAGCYKIFGPSPRAALMVQMLLSSLILLLVFMLAWFVFRNRWIAWWSAVVTALHPGFLIMSGLLMSETLFVFLFLLFMIFLIRAQWAWAGCMLGCASLVRPVGLPVLILALCVMIFGWVKDGSRDPFQLFFFLFSYLLVITPWLMRNFLLTGGIFLHTLSAPHLLNHGAARVVMHAQGVSYESAQKQVRCAVDDELLLSSWGPQRTRDPFVKLIHPFSSEHAYLTAGESVAMRIFLTHPFATIKLCCVNIFKTMFGLYSSELLVVDSGGQLPTYDDDGLIVRIKRFLAPTVHNRWIAWVIYLELLLNFLIMLGVAGCCWGVVFDSYRADGSRIYVRDDKKKMAFLSSRAGTRDPFQTIILLSFAALFIVLSCICGFARLRLPSEPFFIMLAIRQLYLLTAKKEHGL